MFLNPVQVSIRAFKSVKRLAVYAGTDSSSVCRWRKRGLIPNQKQARILKAARELKLDLTAEDMIFGRYSELTNG